MITESATRISPINEHSDRSLAASQPASANEPCAFRLRETEDGIGILTFDSPGSSANVFDPDTLEELAVQLRTIECRRQLRGVVLTSEKPSIFIAGADLRALGRWAGRSGETLSPELVSFVESGQRIFDQLARIPVPVVAAIHGACVGGGFEAALACDYRIASPDRSTRIGLPETQLGLLPAWGGSTRLPRLVGLPKALDVILNGRSLPAVPALKRGLIDEIVPRERLIEVACERIRKRSSGLKARPRRWLALLNHRLAAWGLRCVLSRAVSRRTRGHYPAVLKALDVVTRGVVLSPEAALRLEREAILELAQSDVTHNLIRIFLLQERAKKTRVTGADAANAVAKPLPAQQPSTAAVRRAAVIGAGVMGAGIAQWLSSRGVSVILRDVDPERVAGGLAKVAGLYSAGVRRHKFTRVEARQGMDRISPAATEVPMRRVEFIIEAAVEQMPLKQEIFRRLDAAASAETILATNTSALSVTELAAVTGNPGRVVGIHFFNPVHRMQLVEVVAGRQTSLETLQRSVRFVQQLGKLPVVVRDSPGFLVNRILMPYLIEAGELFDQGARIHDIDESMLEFGMPMGPLRLIDEVGVDVARHVAETLAAQFGDRLRVPPILGRLIEGRLLGRKCGSGFYLYEGRRPKPIEELARFDHGHAARRLTRAQLSHRMVLLMVNEAARCLEEDVVTAPEDVDFAMIMGTGFAPFRGGPLRYADSQGIAQIVDEMKRLAADVGPRFAPCEQLRQMAAAGRRFHTA